MNQMKSIEEIVQILTEKVNNGTATMDEARELLHIKWNQRIRGDFKDKSPTNNTTTNK